MGNSRSTVWQRPCRALSSDVFLWAFCVSSSGRRPGRNHEEPLPGGVTGLCLQAAGDPGEEEVWVCRAGEGFSNFACSICQEIFSASGGLCFYYLICKRRHLLRYLLSLTLADAGLFPDSLHLLSPGLWACQGLWPLQKSAADQYSKRKRHECFIVGINW